MELMQLNMWQGRLSQQIVELVDERKPEFITAQEIYKGGDTVLAPENMFTLYEQVAKRYPYHSFSAVHALKIARGKAEMGTAIFSQHPIVDTSSFFTHGSYVDGISAGNDVHNSRTLQSATIAVDKGNLQLLTHHGHWVPNAHGDETSVEKMQDITDYIQELDSSIPLIFAGDLNVTPESPAMRPFDGLLTNLVASYAIKNTLSSFRKLKDIPCDHVLVNDKVNVRNLYTLEETVSDHKPVILEFDI